MCAYSVTKSCPTLFGTPMDCRPPGSSVNGISQARILKWVAISFSKGSSWPRDQTRVFCVSCIAGRFFTHWVIGEALTNELSTSSAKNHTSWVGRWSSQPWDGCSHGQQLTGASWDILRWKHPVSCFQITDPYAL